MAKSRSLFNVSGTILGVTHVDSKMYGRYIRAPRGTYKPAVMNDACKKAGAHLLAVQAHASVLRSAIENYRADFKGGQFWQRLLSTLYRQHKQTGAFGLNVLQDMEIYEEFPLQKLWKVNTRVALNRKRDMLKVALVFGRHPRFLRATSVDGYRVHVICLFPDKELSEVGHAGATSGLIALKGKVKKLVFQFVLSPAATQVVVCLKLEGMAKGMLAAGKHTKGMQVVKVVIVG